MSGELFLFEQLAGRFVPTLVSGVTKINGKVIQIRPDAPEYTIAGDRLESRYPPDKMHQNMFRRIGAPTKKPIGFETVTDQSGTAVMDKPLSAQVMKKRKKGEDDGIKPQPKYKSDDSDEDFNEIVGDEDGDPIDDDDDDDPPPPPKKKKKKNKNKKNGGSKSM